MWPKYTDRRWIKTKIPIHYQINPRLLSFVSFLYFSSSSASLSAEGGGITEGWRRETVQGEEVEDRIDGPIWVSLFQIQILGHGSKRSSLSLHQWLSANFESVAGQNRFLKELVYLGSAEHHSCSWRRRRITVEISGDCRQRTTR